MRHAGLPAWTPLLLPQNGVTHPLLHLGTVDVNGEHSLKSLSSMTLVSAARNVGLFGAMFSKFCFGAQEFPGD